MSGIEELRQRVQEAEERFGLSREEQAKYSQRLIGLIDTVESRLIEQQAEIDHLREATAGHDEALAKEHAQTGRFQLENEQLREMLHTLLQAIETGGRGGAVEIMQTLEQKVGTLIAGTAAPAEAAPEAESVADPEPAPETAASADPMAEAAPEPDPEPAPETAAEETPEADMMAASEPEPEMEAAPEPAAEKAPATEMASALEPDPEPVAEVASEPAAEVAPEPEADPVVESAPEPAVEIAPEPEVETASEPTISAMTAPEIAPETAPAAEAASEPEPEAVPEAAAAADESTAAALDEIASQLAETPAGKADDVTDSLHEIMDRVSKLVRETEMEEGDAPPADSTPDKAAPSTEKKSAAG